MKAKVIEGCIACGMCVATCPAVFRMNDEGVAEAYAPPAPVEESATQEAADNCPVNVIVVEN